MATEKKQSFLGGAAVLAFGIVAVKIIGAVFKIPLRNILGEGGSADFSNAYNIYATLLTVSTAGLPVALSKLVSESYALGRTRQAHRTFRVSLSVFLMLGVASFALMWWGSDLLAGFLNNPRAAYGVLDEDSMVYYQRRVEYDVAEAQRRILAAGLPDMLARRLGEGM